MIRRLLILGLVMAVVLGSHAAVADDGFYVIPVPVGMGTRITSLPFTISSPGFYYLGKSLSYSGNLDGITVTSDDVTLDLMGFQLTGPGPTDIQSKGIYLAGRKNVEIRNGSVRNWHNGIFDNGSGLGNRVINLRAANCSYGISLQGFGADNMVKGCSSEAIYTGIYVKGGVVIGNTVRNCKYGIAADGVISGNLVVNSETFGIEIHGASSVIGNTVSSAQSSQTGIFVNTSEPNILTNNAVSGPGTHFHAGSGSVNAANTNAGF